MLHGSHCGKGALETYIRETPEIKRSDLQKIEYGQVLDSQPMYHSLNQRHAELVPLLTQKLRTMKRDGTLMELRRNKKKKKAGVTRPF